MAVIFAITASCLILREAHELCDRHRDVATASLIENWIDETEGRTWFLAEITRNVWRVDRITDLTREEGPQ